MDEGSKLHHGFQMCFICDDDGDSRGQCGSGTNGDDDAITAQASSYCGWMVVTISVDIIRLTKSHEITHIHRLVEI